MARPGGTAGGRGDGAVEVSVPDVPAFSDASVLPCPVTRRLRASDETDPSALPRPLGALALSPAYLPADGAQVVPGGTFLIGATLGNKMLCGAPGNPDCGEGGIILLRTNVAVSGPAQSALVPAPPADIF